MPLTEYFKKIRGEVDKTLDALLPPKSTYPAELHEAMRYSVFAGGKRLRPMLAISACDVIGGDRKTVLPFASALELVHTYTLIHDDLPALDNDDLRRGQPTNHKKFGESTAIMAGDALLTLAFEVITNRALFNDVSAETLIDVTSQTALAIGSTGTIGGQVVDLAKEEAEPDLAALEYIHTHKTGKLITVSVTGGATLAGAEKDQIDALTQYGKNIGLAFQIVDDILDVVGDEKSLGKDIGSDTAKGKMTYPSVLGMEESRKLAARLTDNALQSLEMFGDDSAPLADIAKYIIARNF